MFRERALVTVFLAAVIASAGWLTLGAAPPTPVFVDGRPLPHTALAIVKDREYATLRGIGDALGAQVGYDGRARRAVIITEFREVMILVDRPVAIVNGVEQRIDAPAVLRQGRVLVPLRATMQALGASIRYDATIHAVAVSTGALNTAPRGAATAPPVPATNTLQGTVTDVQSTQVPPALAVDVNGLSYTITVPEGTKIQFRDTRGGSAGAGPLSQVRPGDTLIATLDAAGHVLSIADIFAGFNGTVAAVNDQSMVLTNGRVVAADKSQTAVTLDGRPAAFSDLKPGDLVTVRADPRTGKVRDVVALTPSAMNTSATATPSAAGQTTAVRIDDVRDDAKHAFRTGQTLHVAVDGTPGATATFDLSNVIVGNAMTESRPGHYEGAYVIEVGTNLVDAPIIVRLSKNGATAQAEGPDPLAIITTPPAVRDVKPDAGTRVNNARPNVYVTFATVGDRGLDAQSIKLRVNGRDVTGQATRTPAFVSYYPQSDFSAGPVTVEITGADTAGNKLFYKWSFTVVR